MVWRMITVAGEALMDVVVDDSGTLTALAGGAPFNVARNVALLGCDCTFLGTLSDDLLGQRLRAALLEAGVTISVARTTSAPTALALAELDESGTATYRFYLEGTAAGRLLPSDIPNGILEGSHSMTIGGLGLILEPMASTLLAAVRRVSPQTMVLLDPNCRPQAIRDMALYRERLRLFLRRVDVLKLSVEDLRTLAPDHELGEAAQRLLALGPAAVLVTDGPAPVNVLCASGERLVPVPEVTVVDTIGAGDAFVAGFLAWWRLQGLGRKEASRLDLLNLATKQAVKVACAECTMKGANLPEDFNWTAG
jgi:fructokinase